MPLEDRPPQNATAAYIAPFIAFVALMVVERAAALPAGWFYPIRFAVVLALLAFVSRRAVSLRASAPLASAAVGIAVFLIWIAPDVLLGAGYRHHWLFDNAVVGTAASSAPDALKHNWWFIFIRTLGCTALVPVMEELFWRGWLMRWLAHHEFEKVPLGAYIPSAFWVVAVLFASEHGPYWDVGLAAGIIYNWWIVRTKNLADCIVAHAVTNGLLSLYVLLTGQWQYWL
jgi:CAAX prenyl protease-like protein